MKILSKYILKEHLPPFFGSIAIVTFVMLLDRILDLLDLVITKQLLPFTTFKLFGLSLPFMLAMSIPMAVLVGTIMAFGRLSSDNEITAFKANGINIYRMLSPIVITAILLTFFMIYFNNHIMPDSNFALKNLIVKIHARKPTSELKPGLFTKLKNFNFYYHSKDEEKNLFNQIVIYDKESNNFPRTITAKTGEISLSNGGNSLTAILFDGEIHEIDKNNPINYNSISFLKYKIVIPDLGIKVNSSRYTRRGDREMSSAAMKKKVEELNKTRSSKIENLNKYQSKLDEIENDVSIQKKSKSEIMRVKQKIQNTKHRIKSLDSKISRYQVEIQKKYSIAFACLVFILIGAPIGMMTRTNTLGSGLAVSSFVFLVYYITLYAGEELADRLIMSPFLAMWISNIIFSLIGIYLVIFSVRERKIIHIEKIKKIFSRKNRK
ncbi:MAG: LptF/LptG family permease [Candidatus Cloacimonetes bacterium]|nr:LptF/LptG family permease [Candidatus Cloacimonadota bacterium]